MVFNSIVFCRTDLVFVVHFYKKEVIRTIIVAIISILGFFAAKLLWFEYFKICTAVFAYDNFKSCFGNRKKFYCISCIQSVDNQIAKNVVC